MSFFVKKELNICKNNEISFLCDYRLSISYFIYFMVWFSSRYILIYETLHTHVWLIVDIFCIMIGWSNQCYKNHFWYNDLMVQKIYNLFLLLMLFYYTVKIANKCSNVSEVLFSFVLNAYSLFRTFQILFKVNDEYIINKYCLSFWLKQGN